MRTYRCSGRRQMSVWGVWCHFLSVPMFFTGGSGSGAGVCLNWEGRPPPVNRMTHASENLPYLAVGNKKAFKSNVNRPVGDSMGEIVKTCLRESSPSWTTLEMSGRWDQVPTHCAERAEARAL